MASQARVRVLNEATMGEEGNWKLCFQYCRYEYEDDTEENGYRFIWRRPNGNMQGPEDRLEFLLLQK